MSGNAVTAVAVTGEDADLVAAVRLGDDRAFEELYQRYHPRVAAYVRGMVKDHARSEDVTQEVFFSALRRIRQTERPIAFKPWVYEIARNACIDAYRRSSRAEELSYDVEGGLPPADSMRLVSSNPGPDDAVESKQRLDDLCGAFGGLSETHHQILVLRELEGLSYREIGERLGMSRAAVESTLFRARRRLTEEYDELVSGRRCQRVQAIIAAAAEGMLGTRDRRRLARHVSTCQACRRQARRLGVEVAERPAVAARIAGALPFPLVFWRGRGGGTASPGQSSPGLLAHASASLGAAAEPMAAAWTKAVAAIAVLAIAGAGAGAVSKHGLSVPGLGDLPVVGGLAGDGGGDAGGAGAQGILAPGGAFKGGGVGASPAPSRGTGAARPTPATRSGTTDSRTGSTGTSPRAGGEATDSGSSLAPALPSGAPKVDLPSPGGSGGGGATSPSATTGSGGSGPSGPSVPESPKVSAPKVSAPASTKPAPSPKPAPATGEGPSILDASAVTSRAAAVGA